MIYAWFENYPVDLLILLSCRQIIYKDAMLYVLYSVQCSTFSIDIQMETGNLVSELC